MLTADVAMPPDAPVLPAVPTTVDVPIHPLDALALDAGAVLLATLVVTPPVEPRTSPPGMSLRETAPPQAASMARSAPRTMVREAKCSTLMKLG
jgi:hypothetical protein